LSIDVGQGITWHCSPVLGELGMREAFKLDTQMKRGGFQEASSRDEFHSIYGPFVGSRRITPE